MLNDAGTIRHEAPTGEPASRQRGMSRGVPWGAAVLPSLCVLALASLVSGTGNAQDAVVFQDKESGYALRLPKAWKKMMEPSADQAAVGGIPEFDGVFQELAAFQGVSKSAVMPEVHVHLLEDAKTSEEAMALVKEALEAPTEEAERDSAAPARSLTGPSRVGSAKDILIANVRAKRVEVSGFEDGRHHELLILGCKGRAYVVDFSHESSEAETGANRRALETAFKSFTVLDVAGPFFSGQVSKVTDGDTIWVMHNGKPEEIRLQGIDCPEVPHQGKPGQKFGCEARQFTAKAVCGKKVTIKVTGTDKFGRTLGEVILPDGRDLSQELVRSGLARWYSHYSTDKTLRTLEGEAKAARRGLWSEKNQVAPWDFRHQHEGR